MQESEQNAKLHTAEHIFARCLQNQGLELRVRKVDTQRKDGVGEAFFIGIIPLEKLLAAEQETINVITRGLEVGSEQLADIDSAKKKFPKLRFNQEMLAEVQGITVVKIGDFDIAACAQKHTKNTREIGAFAISSVSYPSGETKMMFRAGSDAIEYMLKVKGRVLEIASSDNFDAERINERYKAVKQSLKELNDDADSIIETMLQTAKKPGIYVKAANINPFYKQISEHLRRNPEKYFIVFNDNQILGVKGVSCSADMERIGKELKDKGAFVGAIKTDSIGGKVLDLKKVQELLS